MSQPELDDDSSEVQRDRRVQHLRGMKPVRIWVPDPSMPGFAEEAARQAAILNGAPDADQIMRFIEAVADWPEP